MRAFLKFNRGLLKLPHVVKLWLGLLMAVNLVVPLFYLGQAEARWVLAAFFASFGLMVFITSRWGFTRLLGLGHVLWIPLIIYLVTRFDEHQATGFYEAWIRVVCVLNGWSLILDAQDVVKYAGGAREEVVDI